MAANKRIGAGRNAAPLLPLAGMALVLSLLLASPAWPGDWPQWRGPNRNAVWTESGPIDAFPPEGLAVRWRAPVSFGWSSPIVAQGRVFVTDSHFTAPEARERIHCFDETSGKPLWTYSYEAAYPEWAFTPDNEGRLSATPIAEDGRVYMLGGNGDVHCLAAATGELLWKRELGKDYNIAVLSCRASPLIEGNLLIVFTGAKPGAAVMALDKFTGKEVWKALDESVTNSSPLVVPSGGTRQLIVWTGQSVTSLGPATGNVYWHERLGTAEDYVVASPVFHNDRLLIGGLMLELDRDKPAASVLWPKRRAASLRILSNTSTAAIVGDTIYSARSSGEFVALDANTGEQLWQTDKVTTLANGASAHITLNGDSALLYNEGGELIRARLTPQGYEELGRVKLLEPTYPFAGRNCAWAPPAYANRHVFARSDKEIVCASLVEGVGD